MTGLLTQMEITKFARELGVEADDLEFLGQSAPADLRALRQATSAAMFARNEPRVRTLASLSKLLPGGITAKIAEHALGARLCARVAGALHPSDATVLATYLSTEFLAKVASGLDPQRVAEIVRGLPDLVVVEVGRILLHEGDHVTLARFVSIVEPSVALKVVEHATGHDLLQVGLYADEPDALDAIVRELPDHTLIDVLKATADTGAYDAAVGLLTSLSPESCARLVRHVAVIPEDAREHLIEAVALHDVWPSVLPAMHVIEPAVLGALVNVPATLDPALIDTVLTHARTLDLAPSVVQLVITMDEDRIEAVRKSSVVREPGVQEWLLATSGVSRTIVEGVLDALGLR